MEKRSLSTRAIFIIGIAAGLFANNVSNAEELTAPVAIQSAKAKVEALASYLIDFDEQNTLYPESAGVMVKVKGKVKGQLGFKRYRDTTKGYVKQQAVDESLFFFLKLSSAITIWGGNEIFSFDSGKNNGYKMKDYDENRGPYFIPMMYKAFLQENSLKYLGRKIIDKKICHLLEGKSEILTPLTKMDAIAQVAIDPENGFPVQIFCKNGKSETTINFSNAQINPEIKDSAFSIPSNIKFENVRKRGRFQYCSV